MVISRQLAINIQQQFNINSIVLLCYRQLEGLQDYQWSFASDIEVKLANS